MEYETNLNTSNVTVNLYMDMEIIQKNNYLNTSNVTVNPKQRANAVALVEFKYI